jgi:solute:Na+ symporter, SSS family
VTSLVVMTAIQVLPKLPWTRELWARLIGPEIFWPWYTLIGTAITLGTALVMRGRAGVSSHRRRSA